MKSVFGGENPHRKKFTPQKIIFLLKLKLKRGWLPPNLWCPREKGEVRIMTNNPLIVRLLSEKSYLCMVMRMFMGQGLPHTLKYLYHAPDIAAVGTISIVFSFDAVSGQDSNLSPSQQKRKCTMSYPRVVGLNFYTSLRFPY